MRIDGERSTQCPRTSDCILRFRVTAGSAVEYKKTGFAACPVTAASARSDNQKVVDVVDSQRIHYASRVRAFEDTLWRNVPVGHAVIDQDSVALRNKDFIINCVNNDAVRGFETGL